MIEAFNCASDKDGIYLETDPFSDHFVRMPWSMIEYLRPAIEQKFKEWDDERLRSGA
jgi:hypothetical protein